MIETIVSICLGIGLAASAGFRVFVPLFVLSIATHYGYVPVGNSFLWIGSTTAMICLGIATIVEIIAYYIPYIDNLLDTIAIPLATIAGTIAMASTMIDIDPMLTWGLAIIAGGGSAAAISSATTATRATSTVTTGGIGNSVVSTTETATASFVSVTAIFLPVLALLLVILIVFIGIKVFRKFFNKNK
ncbi:membrane protein [Flavobacterium sp. 316]|uniref:DUF4126 domain-containing protein n=1 Tax=Flavobacterium sp. 316 TaxID=1603293 RepID=UPI0005DF51DF|nr:DUF4126 domain-containing protein [Flavobacterium sp. 316]KIX22810.1 membrane protein [Flavobacterium sp. 316]